MSETDRKKILEDDRYLIHPLHHPSDHQSPVIFVRGQGAVVTDIDGRSYIDGLSGLWNVAAGHGRQELVEAAAAQMNDLAYFSCYTGATNIPAARLAARLAGLAPGRLNHTFLTTGGAESNDSAIKTARFFWQTGGRNGKVKIIGRRHGYHGVTIGAMNATGIETYWPMFESRLPDFLHVDTPYPYRFTPVEDGVGCGEAAARSLEEAILREGPDTVAAFIAEPVQGAGGVIVPPDDYWPRIRGICSRYDTLLIADEVITGFGRIGSWFGLSRWDVEPDIITFAKAVTSGYMPLGGIIVSDAIREAIEQAPPSRKWNHSFSYSGHPACCAVALANIDLIEREGLIERGVRMGQKLLAGLETLYDLEHVGNVRGIGLMAAVELTADRASRTPFDPSKKMGARVLDGLMRRGVYTRCRGDSVNFAPPLVVTEEQIDHIVEVTREAVIEATRDV